MGKGNRISARLGEPTIRAAESVRAKSTKAGQPEEDAPVNDSYDPLGGKLGGRKQLRRPSAKTRRKPRSKSRSVVLLLTTSLNSERPRSMPARGPCRGERQSVLKPPSSNNKELRVRSEKGVTPEDQAGEAESEG